LPEFPLLSRLISLSIVENAALRELGPMSGLRSVDGAWLEKNPVLVRAAAFAAVERAGELYVNGNAALVELDLGQLTQIERILRIAHNTSLDAAGLPRPEGANHVIGGNLGDALGLDPCPWTGNGYCEGPPLDDLCAAGSDRVYYDTP
jgi:hypothetical protein